MLPLVRSAQAPGATRDLNQPARQVDSNAMGEGESAGDRRDSSNLTIALVIEYVRDRAGESAVEELLATAGELRPLAELLDEGRWSTYEQKLRLLEAAITVLGDPEIPRLVGATVLERRTGMAVRLLLRALGSPSSVCRSVAKASAKFSTNYTCVALSVGRDGAVISNRLHDGYEPSLVDCQYTGGLLSQIPALFGLEPAVVAHDECQARGAAACIYNLKWRAHRRWPGTRRHNRASYIEEELRLVSERYEALQSTIIDLASPADVGTVLRRITRRAADAVRAQRFLLALSGHFEGPLVHYDGMPVEEAERLAAEVLREEPDDHGGSRLIVDVASSRQFYGRLVAVYDFEHIFFPGERRLFAAYARQAAVALDAATALEEARRRGETASALLELSRQLAQATSTDEVARRLADAVPAVIGADRASVMLWDPERRQLVFRARSSRQPEPPGLAGYGVSVADTPALDEMLRTLQPQHICQKTADPYLRDRMRESSIEEMLAVPIQSDGEMLGAIAAVRGTALPAVVDQQALADRLSGLADQAALAFEKVRLLEQEREAVRRLQRNERRIKHLAYHDALTGLPNGRYFWEALQSGLQRADAEGGRLALLFCDLDRFKNVNDSLGHDKGDVVLKAAAARLQTCVRDTDTLARLGGDEFTLLVPGVAGTEEATSVAERVLAGFRDPVNLDGQELFLSASVGVALFPDDGADAQTLLKNADTAMYQAKLAGRNKQRRYAAAMNAQARRLLELEAGLHEALRRRELVVHYQPQVVAATGQLVAVEALVRWCHPQRGMLCPGEFIGLAEERGLIGDIDAYVLHEAARQCKQWEEAGFPPVRVGVNLSAHQFRGADLLGLVTGVLHDTGLRPELLELELTETAAMQEPERAADVLRQLRALGIRLALDDFGTGYSSWTHLKHFPVGGLKIDRSFVSGLPGDRHDRAIVSAMIEMAHHMGMSVTAEGVETADQACFLARHGCDLLQGFLYSKARPSDEITELLRNEARVERAGVGSGS
ncbi:MAG TPA: EAL domain-containing protein [Acidimicrobiales bacterium]|nr:EAL domain-containing protein [Acidimicrobiales bacterium]